MYLYARPKVYINAYFTKAGLIENYKTGDLDSGNQKTQCHAGELKVGEQVFVTIDVFYQGLGSITSWGTLPLEAYRLPCQSYKFSYWMLPIK